MSRGVPNGLTALPDLDGLEEGIDNEIVIAVTLATNRLLGSAFVQDFPVVMRAVLAAPVAVEQVAAWQGLQGNCNLLLPDSQITLHAFADRPTFDAVGMQIQDHRQISATTAGLSP